MMVESKLGNGHSPKQRIALVGPCSSGKSTLAAALSSEGYEVRQPAQEHSCVPNMWQICSKPDILIYLDVNYQQARVRRPYIDGGPQRLENQRKCLVHALQWCDFYLDTSDLGPEEVEDAVFTFLKNRSPKK